MTATSHAVTGAAIGVFIKEPALALPLAFTSHFVFDALPHFGLDEFGGHLKKQKLFHKILFVDASLLAVLIVCLLVLQAPWLVLACLFLAGCPDFVWAYRYVFQEKLGAKKPRKMNVLNKFHARIQWSQTLRGILVEAPLAFVLIAYVTSKL